VPNADPFQAAVMSNSGFTARVYNACRRLVTSEFQPVDHVRAFVDQADPAEVVVEVGSGNRRLSPRTVNLDLFRFANVDALADATRLPLREGSVDRAVLDSVLEHVPEPQRVVDEVHRAVRPGGQVVCVTPFVFPYHAYPRHYFNFTRDGLEYLFRAFRECRVSVHQGPTSGAVNLVAEMAAALVTARPGLAYTVAKGSVLALTFPLKYLDVLWRRSPGAHNVASMLVVHARK
jgi:SAM-dependent methyltransferase